MRIKSHFYFSISDNAAYHVIDLIPDSSRYEQSRFIGGSCRMAFNLAAFSYIVALIGDAFLIFFAIFHVITFDELKTGYKNPIDQCNNLNPLVLPEYILHFVINVLFLIGEQYFSLFINIPLIAYHVWRYMNRPLMTESGLYDPTSIMNAYDLSMYHREGWIKLAFYLLSFFYYLYGMISSLIH